MSICLKAQVYFHGHGFTQCGHGRVLLDQCITAHTVSHMHSNAHKSETLHHVHRARGSIVGPLVYRADVNKISTSVQQQKDCDDQHVTQGKKQTSETFLL